MNLKHPGCASQPTLCATRDPSPAWHCNDSRARRRARAAVKAGNPTREQLERLRNEADARQAAGLARTPPKQLEKQRKKKGGKRR